LPRKDEIRVITDIKGDPHIMYPKEAWDEGTRMLVDAPLVLRGELAGIIRVFFSERRELTGEEIKFLLFTSRHSACAIETAGLMQRQRTQYERLARQTEKLSALGRMAAGIAHEINNPLAGILLYSSNMIKKVEDGGPLKEGLEVIIHETKRCKSIIQDLLEFSRVGKPDTAPANINDILEKALSMLANEFRLRHIRLEKQLADEVPDIFLDDKQIQQVFINVILNAVQAVEKKGVIIVRSMVVPEDKLVRVEISDSGGGISNEDLARLFEPFFSTKSNGTGLGLSVSYNIIQNHGGDIQVESMPGEGTCFTIDLPVSLSRSFLMGGGKGRRDETG
jgi:signal transduction histidine kinase